jgi:hypothetical protein
LLHHRQPAWVGHAASAALARPWPANKVRVPTARPVSAVRRANVGDSPEGVPFFSNFIFTA